MPGGWNWPSPQSATVCRLLALQDSKVGGPFWDGFCSAEPMRIFLVLLVLIVGAPFCLPGALPLTTKQISLMLRSGYSSEVIMREVAARHYGENFDVETEKELTRAGANAALLDALRSGSFRASDAEISAAEEKIAAQEETAREAQEHSSAPPPPQQNTRSVSRSNHQSASPLNQVYRLLKGDLVFLNQGAVRHFDDDALEQKKYFLFFFSANWSPVGRKFTPTLIEYYKRVQPQHPEFEVIFFSADRSQFGMESYIRQTNMPWPAISFDQINAKAKAIDEKFIKELPCLLLVDASSQILSSTSGVGQSENRSGPEKVLADLDRILSSGGNPSAK